VTDRADQLAICALGAAGLALIAILAPSLADVRADEFFAEPIPSLSTLVVAAGVTAAVVLRPLWAGSRFWFATRFVIGAYVVLLLLGAAAISALRLLAELGYPIAATQRLPTVPQTVYAVKIAALGGVCLLAGTLVGALLGRPRAVSPHEPPPATEQARVWLAYRRAVPYLVAIGVLGCALTTASTGQIPLFSQNIDALRFRQGQGLGFASLFQYELLLVACLATAGLVVDPRWRRRWALWLVGALVLLVMFRVERTPLIAVSFVMLLTLVATGRRTSPAVVATVATLVVALVAGLGVLRLASSSSLADKREAVVRPLFDVAPELREQAYVYEIYPDLHGFTAGRDLAAVASSIVPGTLLGLVGVDKSAIYTDVSRDYSATMRQLGYYPRSEKPLRVGLVGELYADFGLRGVVVGLFGFGILVGLIPLRPGIPPKTLIPVVLLGVLATMLLIIPAPALLPIALMVLIPLLIVHRK